MQSHRPQDAHSPQPHVFRESLDWRFLLPIGDASQVYVLFTWDAEFSRTLERAGIPVANHWSFSDFGQERDGQIQSLALPFGLPLGQVGAKLHEHVEFYSSCRGLIIRGGSFLVGFDNILRLRASPESKYYLSTPARIAHQLSRAGYRSIKIFGVLSNLKIPEYIFDLDSRTIHFALQNRFRRQPAILQALRLLSATIGLAPISNFMPSYFAVATA